MVDGLAVFANWPAAGIIFDSVLQSGSTEDNFNEDRVFATDTTQIRIREIGLAKVCLIKRCTVQISPDKNCPDQGSSTEIGPIQICAT